MRLLRDWLSVKQLAQFDAIGQFDVIGSDTGKCYRIRRGKASNVYEFGEDGRAVAAWCFFPVGYLGIGDVMLAQKIALETNEAETLEIAHRLPLIQSHWR